MCEGGRRRHLLRHVAADAVLRRLRTQGNAGQMLPAQARRSGAVQLLVPLLLETGKETASSYTVDKRQMVICLSHLPLICWS